MDLTTAAQAEPSSFADIVILGAGYGGLHVAQRLGSLLMHERHPDGTPWTIALVDRLATHQLTTELPRIIGNEIPDSALMLPLARLLDARHVRFVQATVQAIEPAAGEQPGAVVTSAGRIGYGFLVIALGSVSNDYGVPGVHEHMLRFLTNEDARTLRVAVSRAIQDAARLELDQPQADPAELERRMTVLIGGAGPTGVEVAGELAEYMADQWEAARQLAGAPNPYRLPKPRIILVSTTPTILPGWSSQAIQAATDALRALGVDLRLPVQITRAEAGRVQLQDGTWITAGTLLWTGGVRAPNLLRAAGLQTGSNGRIVVDPFQRTVTHPNIYAVGDSALLLDPRSGRPAPPTADIALRSGETAALALAAIVRGQAPERVLRPVARNAVSVGRQRGATNLLGIKLRGRPARTIKALIEWEYRQSITRLHGASLATLV